MRTLRILRNILALIGAISLGWLAYTYTVEHLLVFPWVWEETMRLRSPSGSKEMVAFRGNRGAMSSYRYSYFIVSRGEHIDPNAENGYDAVFVCGSPAPTPVWKEEKRLVIPARDSRVFYYVPQKKALGVFVDVISDESTH
jgi:hypothetical protein